MTKFVDSARASLLIHGKLHRARRLVARIDELSRGMARQTEQDLRSRSAAVRWRAFTRTPHDEMLPEAFALVREAARRVHNMPHFDVQLWAGVVLAGGDIAEMQTGEGKTLAALLPAYLRALCGQGCHVVTANDYLAQRDAAFARPVFDMVGLTVGGVHDGMPREQRAAEYECDVTYGTAREFGFDFLRDTLETESHDGTTTGGVQRGHYFALVDEADSILLDDARTPLLIATQNESFADATIYQWSDTIAGGLRAGLDFTIDEKTLRARLSRHGTHQVLCGRLPARLANLDRQRLYSQVEHAIVARHLLGRDRDYIVRDEGVSIVDPSTGRTSDGRKWRGGLHQAVEAKEGVPLSEVTQTAASITVQGYFRRYAHLAGLTGTASQSQGEFRRVYGLSVVAIPTRRPCLRRALPARVFVSQAAKHGQIVRDVREHVAAGSAVLVGTPSVRASEALSKVLSESNIDHEVLNCRAHERESEIIQQAGQSGRVTVATNMAGRGTDIRIDDRVRAAGGLHVMATEMHASRRTDRQLVGRTARQGDPGAYQFMLSLEDELLQRLPSKTRHALREQARPDQSGELSSKFLSIFRRAQRSLERRHERDRRTLLKAHTEHERRCRQMGLSAVLESIDP